MLCQITTLQALNLLPLHLPAHLQQIGLSSLIIAIPPSTYDQIYLHTAHLFRLTLKRHALKSQERVYPWCRPIYAASLEGASILRPCQKIMMP